MSSAIKAAADLVATKEKALRDAFGDVDFAAAHTARSQLVSAIDAYRGAVAAFRAATLPTAIPTKASVKRDRSGDPLTDHSKAAAKAADEMKAQLAKLDVQMAAYAAVTLEGVLLAYTDLVNGLTIP